MVTTCSQSVTQEMHLLPPVTTCIHCFIEKPNHYPSLPHVTSLLHKKCARYHLHPLCFLAKSNCYQSLPLVLSSQFVYTLVTTCNQSVFPRNLVTTCTSRHHMCPACYTRNTLVTTCNHSVSPRNPVAICYQLLPKVASLLHKKYSCYHPLSLASSPFPWEI